MFFMNGMPTLLSTVVIPSTITSIGSGAFSHNTALHCVYWLGEVIDTPNDIFVGSPSAIPCFIPSLLSTGAPTYRPTVGALNCSYFSFNGVVQPSHDATVKYNDCHFILPPPTSLYIHHTITLSTGCGCIGDTFIRLIDPSGLEIIHNDNTCGHCSSIAFTPNASTYTTGVYTIRAGCAGNSSCAGRIVISGFEIGKLVLILFKILI